MANFIKNHKHIWKEHWTTYEQNDRLSGFRCEDKECKAYIGTWVLVDLLNALSQKELERAINEVSN